jgi:hypothetical protein
MQMHVQRGLLSPLTGTVSVKSIIIHVFQLVAEVLHTYVVNP